MADCGQKGSWSPGSVQGAQVRSRPFGRVGRAVRWSGRSHRFCSSASTKAGTRRSCWRSRVAGSRSRFQATFSRIPSCSSSSDSTSAPGGANVTLSRRSSTASRLPAGAWKGVVLRPCPARKRMTRWRGSRCPSTTSRSWRRGFNRISAVHDLDTPTGAAPSRRVPAPPPPPHRHRLPIGAARTRSAAV